MKEHSRVGAVTKPQISGTAQDISNEKYSKILGRKNGIIERLNGGEDTRNRFSKEAVMIFVGASYPQS
jgi:hypothetical protein